MQDGQQGDNNNAQPGWTFKPGDSVNQPPANIPEPDVQSRNNLDAPGAELSKQDPFGANEPYVSWTASEYLANPKSAGWFGSLALASVLLAVIIYFITKDIIPTVVIGLVGVIIGVFAARQPRVLEYHLDNKGIYIGHKFYAYSMFKSFSIANDQALGYISLMPLKRFMPPLVIHYDPNDEDKIADTLASYLPFEEHKRDIIDNISRRFRL